MFSVTKTAVFLINEIKMSLNNSRRLISAVLSAFGFLSVIGYTPTGSAVGFLIKYWMEISYRIWSLLLGFLPHYKPLHFTTSLLTWLLICWGIYLRESIKKQPHIIPRSLQWSNRFINAIMIGSILVPAQCSVGLMVMVVAKPELVSSEEFPASTTVRVIMLYFFAVGGFYFILFIYNFIRKLLRHINWLWVYEYATRGGWKNKMVFPLIIIFYCVVWDYLNTSDVITYISNLIENNFAYAIPLFIVISMLIFFFLYFIFLCISIALCAPRMCTATVLVIIGLVTIDAVTPSIVQLFQGIEKPVAQNAS